MSEWHRSNTYDTSDPFDDGITAAAARGGGGGGTGGGDVFEEERLPQSTTSTPAWFRAAADASSDQASGARATRRAGTTEFDDDENELEATAGQHEYQEQQRQHTPSWAQRREQPRSTTTTSSSSLQQPLKLPSHIKVKAPDTSKLDLETRRKRLEARRVRCEQRELELGILEEDKAARPINWPMCCPRIHHNLDQDIEDPTRRKACRAMYYAWLVTIVAYFWNVLALIACLAAGNKKSVGDFFFAALVAVAGIAISGRVLYLGGAYYALQFDAGANAVPYLWFFTHFLFHIVWCCWMLVGPPIVGNFAAGLYFVLLQGTHLFAGDKAPGVFAVINVILWGIALLLSLRAGGLILGVFRNSGGVAKAQQQRAVAQATVESTAAAAHVAVNANQMRE